MPSVAVTLTPVDRARRRIELPVITADDTPTRNPCKVKGTPNGRTFRNEPYGFKAIDKQPPATNASQQQQQQHQQQQHYHQYQQQQQQQPQQQQQGMGKMRVAMPALSDETSSYASSARPYQPQPPQQSTQLLNPVVHVGVRLKPKGVTMSLGLEAPDGGDDVSSNYSGSSPPSASGRGRGGPPSISGDHHTGDNTPASVRGGAATGNSSNSGDTPGGFSRQQTNDSTVSSAPSPPKGLGIDSPPRGGGQTPHTPSGQEQANPAMLSPPSATGGHDPSPSEAFASGGRESKFKSSKPAIAMTEKKYANTAGLAVVVKFKHQDGVFIIPETTNEPYREGDFVVVEGDRGEHVGRIDQMHIHHRHSTASVGIIQRKAFKPEIDLVHRLRMQEPQITRQVQEFAASMDVAMEVIDTELQTDRNKVTVYYRSKVDGPVDFRQLQRRLFREFRCRIWFIDWETM